MSFQHPVIWFSQERQLVTLPTTNRRNPGGWPHISGPEGIGGKGWSNPSHPCAWTRVTWRLPGFPKAEYTTQACNISIQPCWENCAHFLWQRFHSEVQDGLELPMGWDYDCVPWLPHSEFQGKKKVIDPGGSVCMNTQHHTPGGSQFDPHLPLHSTPWPLHAFNFWISCPTDKSYKFILIKSMKWSRKIQSLQAWPASSAFISTSKTSPSSPSAHFLVMFLSSVHKWGTGVRQWLLLRKALGTASDGHSLSPAPAEAPSSAGKSYRSLPFVKRSWRSWQW